MNDFLGPQTIFDIGVIASDDSKKNSAQDNSSNQKVIMPGTHGSRVDHDHLAFSSLMLSPSAWDQQTNPAILTPGTRVIVAKQQGATGGVILGILNTIIDGNMESNAGGGTDLMNVNQATSQLASKKMKIRPPPQIKETTKNGVKVREVKESGENFSLDLLDGLPTHGALFNMAGFRLPEIKNVPTAKQKNTNMMTDQMMEQLGGQLMSLGQMFQSMMSKGRGGSTAANDALSGLGSGPSYMDETLGKLSPAMQKSVTSLSNLIQGYEAEGSGVAYVTGGVVHEGVFLRNAADLISQATNIDDLMYVLQRLQWDNSLHGLNEIQKIETEVEDAWGVALQTVDIDGNITIQYANTDSTNAISDFANTINDPVTAPSAGYGGQGSGSGGGGSQGLGNMFGQSAGIMQQMFKRLATVSEKESRQMTEKLNQDSKSQKKMEIVKKTIQGGNPVDPQNLDDQSSGFGVSFME